MILGCGALAWPSLAQAGFPGERFAESMVLGANVVVALGEPQGARVGWGLDVGYQIQWYTQESMYLGEDFYVWAEEHPAPSYGPVAHLWRHGGAWHASLGARAGVTWPLRMGLTGGWFPGPGVCLEASYLISQAGYAGLDLSGVLDAPWLQLRLGQALTADGWQARRLHAGAFALTSLPQGWEGTESDLWRRPE